MNIFTLRELKKYLKEEKRSIGFGIAVYFLFLVIILIFVIGYTITLGSMPLNLLLIEVILSFPAIPSALITSYLSKKHYTGFLAVIISGLIVISIISLIIVIILLGEVLGPPPIEQYEDFGRRMLILLFFLFYLFFIFPIAGLSATFAVLTELLNPKTYYKRTRK